MDNNKTTINVNGEEIEVDFETMDEKEAEDLGIHIHADNEGHIKIKRRKHRIRGKIMGITPFVVLIAFFLVGFLGPKEWNAWSWNWSFFLAIPVVGILMDITKRPFLGVVSGLLILSVFIAYFVTGFIFHYWHWNWVLFFLIPIISILFGKNND